MSDQQDVPTPEFETETPNPYARRRRRWHWLLAFAVLIGGTYYIVSRPGGEPGAENVPPEMQVTPPAADAALPPDPNAPVTDGAAIPPEPGGSPAPASVTVAGEADPLADPLAPVEGTDPIPPAPAPEEMPIPPPVEAEAPPPAVEPAPEPPAPRVVSKKKKAEKKKTYALAFSKSGTKVPSGLKKDKVLKFLAKKLDGDKSCLPKTLAKKDVKSFTAIVNVSKTGAVTAVTTQPKLADSKKISACIKKKLAGSPATFKGKGKSSARITVALKMK